MDSNQYLALTYILYLYMLYYLYTSDKALKRLECYGSRLKGSSQEATLVLSNTRELNRELFYKLVYFI